MNPGDDILKYFSELTDDQKRRAIEEGLADNTSALDELAMLKDIWKESETLGEFHSFDAAAAEHTA